MASMYGFNATTINGVTPGATGLLVLAAATPSAAQQAMDVEVGVDVQAYSATLAAIAAGTWTGDAASRTGLLPVLSLAASAVDYSLDQDRPSLVQRAPMVYPSATIASLTTTTQGFTVSNSGNGAGAMVATGGLDPGVPRGYIRFTPVVAGGYQWNSATRNAYHVAKVYPRLSSVTDATRDQWWITRIRVPSSVTIANERNAQIDISDSTNAAAVARIAIRYDGGGWKIYQDSTITSASVATTEGLANAGIWLAIKLPAGSRSPTTHYSVAAGTAAPALSSFTQLGLEHTNLLSSGTVDPSIGFAADVAADTATAFAMDVTYYDDSLALPSLNAQTLARVAAGAVSAIPVLACGYDPTQPEYVIIEGPCGNALTQAKLRVILATCENRRLNYDTGSWTWKAERYADGNSPSGGMWAAAASVVVAGTGGNIRVTVRPAADGTLPASLNVVSILGWSAA